LYSSAANAKTGTLYLIGIQSRLKSLCAVTNTVPLRAEKVADSPNQRLGGVAGQTLTTLCSENSGKPVHMHTQSAAIFIVCE
jgi:hypothetical protein